MGTRKGHRQDRHSGAAPGNEELSARRRLQRMRSNAAGRPPQGVVSASASSSRIHCDTLLALRVSALARHFPALGTQLRLALYLDRGALLLVMVAVLDAYLAESMGPAQSRERRDLQPLLAYLQGLLAEPLNMAEVSRRCD